VSHLSARTRRIASWFEALAWRIQHGLPWLWLLYAVPLTLFLSLNVPPFQAPDEPNHFLRALQVSAGGLVGASLGSGRSGGTVDPAVPSAVAPYLPLMFHPENKLTASVAERGRRIAWSADRVPVDFANTASYGPLLYVPQAAGIWLAKVFHGGIVDGLLAARLLNAIGACLAGFLALRLCRWGRALMFSVLLLPMSLHLFASASQDALLITGTFLALALASNAAGRSASLASLVSFLAVTGAAAMARPPCAALFILAPMFFHRRPEQPRHWGRFAVGAILLGLALSVVALWSWWAAMESVPLRPSQTSASDQAWRLMSNPPAFAEILWRTLVELPPAAYKSFVGLLGWLDTTLPDTYYWIAAAMLMAAVVVDAAALPATIIQRLCATLALILAVGGVFLSLYLIWTPVGARTIDGPVGRYFLPLTPLVGWTVSGAAAPLRRVVRLAWLPLALFPLLTLATLPPVIIARYYLQ
jgi:uncharacterized membrane protein